MINKIKNWFGRKFTLILAPNRGSRSFHIHISYSFTAFLILLVIAIFSVGAYFSEIYLSYLNAVNANRILVEEKATYAQKIESTLDMIQINRELESKLRKMLGMKNIRNVIENYHIGGSHAAEILNPILFNERNLLTANVNTVKRETWKLAQSKKNIDNFILRKKDVLLSTPSIWPVFGQVTSKFGYRIHPIRKKRHFHPAIDIWSPLEENAPIRATARGKVVFTGWAGNLGKTILIDHGNGFTTRYAHCSVILVKQTEKVQQGQIIGYIGRTGVSTGVHLSYDVWYRGRPVDPMKFVKGR